MKTIDLSTFRHQTHLDVRFMDFDALHHVNNARYLNFLEESRIKYCQEVLDLLGRIDEFNVLVARIEIDFIKPILFNSSLNIYTKVSRIGRKSMEFESVICSSNKGKKEIIVSRAVQTLVSFNPSTQTSIEVPQEIKAKIESYEKNLQS